MTGRVGVNVYYRGVIFDLSTPLVADLDIDARGMTFPVRCCIIDSGGVIANPRLRVFVTQDDVVTTPAEAALVGAATTLAESGLLPAAGKAALVKAVAGA